MAPFERSLRRWFRRSGEATIAESVLILGLGRFGSSLAETLADERLDVLAVDLDPELVNDMASRCTNVRVADATSTEALIQLGADNFDIAVVAIGTDIEASVLVTAALADLSVPRIWAKAISEQHGRILERVGAHQIVFPERDMGERVAHAVAGHVFDYFQIDDDFVLAELGAPPFVAGLTLAESNLLERFAVTVVSVKPPGGRFDYASSNTVIEYGSHLVIAGATDAIDRFARAAADR